MGVRYPRKKVIRMTTVDFKFDIGQRVLTRSRGHNGYISAIIEKEGYILQLLMTKKGRAYKVIFNQDEELLLFPDTDFFLEGDVQAI